MDLKVSLGDGFENVFPLPHPLLIVHLESIPDRSKAAPLTPALINAKVQPLALYTRKGLILGTSSMSEWTHYRRWDKMLPGNANGKVRTYGNGIPPCNGLVTMKSPFQLWWIVWAATSRGYDEEHF